MPPRLAPERDPMSVLRPITDEEYAAWLARAVPEYAQEKVTSGQWAAEAALALSRQEFEDLLPEGRDSPDNHLHTVLAPDGSSVGTLWFVVKERAGRRIAYVLDITIAPAHRRAGHAIRAFQALEDEAARLQLTGVALHVFGHNLAAQGLYAKLGYVATNVHMFKPLPGPGG
ncbi:MAG: GNAT family N-acetyltransferase [Burkholderiales bacterium]|nr:GNAT family N-acetyltransferase [Burkholderiales bacterium]